MNKLVAAVLVMFSVTTFVQETDANSDKYIELLRTDVRAEKVAILTEAMDFTDEQGSAFWPTYREYEAELGKIYDERTALIMDFAANYESMTEEKAKDLTKNAFALRDRQMKLLKTYHGKVEKAVGGILAARWVQVENQVAMMVDLQIASALPLVE